VAEDRKSFFTSLPGILTGIAAVLTAVGGLIYHNRSKPVHPPKPEKNVISEPVKQPPEKPSEPETQPPEGFQQRASYDGDCGSPPAGSTCLQFRDQYRWLVSDEVGGKRDQVGSWGKHAVMEAVGKHGRYRHIVGTQYVEELPK
jgi:hypothetical protein